MFNLFSLLFIIIIWLLANRNESVRIKWEGYWIGVWDRRYVVYIYVFGFVLPHACALNRNRVGEQECCCCSTTTTRTMLRGFTFDMYVHSNYVLCWWSSDNMKRKHCIVNKSTRIVFKSAISFLFVYIYFVRHLAWSRLLDRFCLIFIFYSYWMQLHDFYQNFHSKISNGKKNWLSSEHMGNTIAQ